MTEPRTAAGLREAEQRIRDLRNADTTSTDERYDLGWYDGLGSALDIIARAALASPAPEGIDAARLAEAIHADEFIGCKPWGETDYHECVQSSGHRSLADRLTERYAALATPEEERGIDVRTIVSLVRSGFLVTVGGRRSETQDIVGEPYRTVLLTILGAEDTDAAYAALGDSRG